MPARDYVVQTIVTRGLTVGTAATPLGNTTMVESYIDSIMVQPVSTAAQSIFFGDSSVTVANGLEIPAGTIINFVVNNERVLYELERPLLQVAGTMQCGPQKPQNIPVVVWDPSRLFLVAAANTDTRLVFFKNPYV